MSSGSTCTFTYACSWKWSLRRKRKDEGVGPAKRHSILQSKLPPDAWYTAITCLLWMDRQTCSEAYPMDHSYCSSSMLESDALSDTLLTPTICTLLVAAAASWIGGWVLDADSWDINDRDVHGCWEADDTYVDEWSSSSEETITLKQQRFAMQWWHCNNYKGKLPPILAGSFQKKWAMIGVTIYT